MVKQRPHQPQQQRYRLTHIRPRNALNWKQMIHQPLSSDQIIAKLGDTQFVPYELVSELDYVDQLLPKSLILYQLDRVGHFVCVFENTELGPGTVNFFDPLGYHPDELLDRHMNPIYRYRYHQNFTYLVDLLAQEDHIVWNEHRYQSSNTSVCGAWCAVRLSMSHLTNDEFWDIWRDIPDRDTIVLKLFHSL